MQSSIQHDFAGRCSDRTQIGKVAARFGLQVLDDAGVREGRALAARLLNDEVASEECFLLIHHAVGSALLGFYEDGALTGFMAAFPLNREGHDRLQAGAFDAINLDPRLVAWDGDAPEAYYGWGFVASTKAGGRAVVKASAALHQELFYATPTYARAVTADGLRALSSLGFRPIIWADPRLLYLAPRQLGPAL